MQIKSQNYKIKGMQKDLSYSAFNPEYSWDNKNIRITARDGNDLLGIANERGNSKILFLDKTPEKVITYTHEYEFINYMKEQTETQYAYISELNSYLIEQSDGWIPPVNYTYEYEFIDYLVEQQNI